MPVAKFRPSAKRRPPSNVEVPLAKEAIPTSSTSFPAASYHTPFNSPSKIRQNERQTNNDDTSAILPRQEFWIDGMKVFGEPIAVTTTPQRATQQYSMEQHSPQQYQVANISPQQAIPEQEAPLPQQIPPSFTSQATQVESPSSAVSSCSVGCPVCQCQSHCLQQCPTRLLLQQRNLIPTGCLLCCDRFHQIDACPKLAIFRESGIINQGPPRPA
ncbi:unnamed protein product, partial [Mesorhabditis spiculigera]